jgi:hypothetical protein
VYLGSSTREPLTSAEDRPEQDECRIAAFDDLITIEKERQDYFSAHPWLLE